MARILVADSERNARNLMKRALEEEGHEVVAVASAEEAKGELWTSKFDALVTDIKFPGMSGIELLRDLSNGGVLPPTIVVSGVITPEAIAEAMKAGASDFLSKPFSTDEFVAKVESLLSMGKETFEKLERRSKELLEAGNLELAGRLIRKMFSMAPSSPIPHFLYYKLLRVRGNLDLAMKHLECALIFDPNYQPAIEEKRRFERGM